jgi:hypothetical protein
VTATRPGLLGRAGSRAGGRRRSRWVPGRIKGRGRRRPRRSSGSTRADTTSLGDRADQPARTPQASEIERINRRGHHKPRRLSGSGDGDTAGLGGGWIKGYGGRHGARLRGVTGERVGGVIGGGAVGGSRVVPGVGGWGVHLSGANVDFLSVRLLGALSWDVARSLGGWGGAAASWR